MSGVLCDSRRTGCYATVQQTHLCNSESTRNNRGSGVSVGAAWRLYNEISGNTRVEAGSNTSTVTLRVVGGDEKGSLKSERVKYGHECQETRTEKDYAGEGQQHIQKTDPSSRQRGRHRKTRP
jgi:hypothetical protein